MQIINKATDLLRSFKEHWTVPPSGRYMSFKEIFSLSFGGIGVKFINYCVTNMIIAVGNTLIGNTIGIDPQAIYVIYIISVLSGFPLTALRARMIDNTRSMKGKYRPYILSMGIPTVALGIGFILMPYESMSLVQKCIAVLLFNIGFQFFFNFFNDAYDSLLNVLSPNTIERTDVSAIKSVVENFSPSIASIFLPLAAKWITGDNTLYDLKVFRVLYPPMLFVGMLISILVYVNTEEKIVQAKTHVVRIKFTDAFRAVARNKYFWIISLAGWIGFLEGSFNSILGWLYNYQSACSAAQYSLITAIAGNASFWPNLVAPFFIRKYGKKKILVFTNILNIGFILLMLPIVRMTGSSSIIWLLLVCTFVNQFITSMGHFLNPSLNADIRDYQQYITGERIDGMFAAVGLIGNVITLATSFVLPTLYERAGLNKTVALSLGYDGSNVYDVLYDKGYFVQIASVLVLASVVGAVLNVIPFFFYDLTETKQKAMVSVLRIRAFFEDYGNNVLEESTIKEAVEIIRNANDFGGAKPEKPSADIIKQARKTKDKQLILAAKEKYKAGIAAAEQTEIAEFVLKELNRFRTPDGIRQIEEAQKIVDAGLADFHSVISMDLGEAKAMPRTTPEEKQCRKDAVRKVKEAILAEKTAKKFFPNGIVAFDASVFETLFGREDRNAEQTAAVLKKMKEAKETKNTSVLGELKVELRQLQVEKTAIEKEIKAATEQNSVYCRAAKPYIEAVKLLSMHKSYENAEAILAECKARITK